MEKQVWIHNLDPFVFKLTESFGVRWYSLAYLTGFACAFFFMSWMIKKKRTPLTLEQASDYLTYLILGVLVGGRVGYALFYSPDLFTDFRSAFPFWGVLAVWEGGMASHGGFLGVFIAVILFSRRHKMDVFHLGDLTVLATTIGIGLGRIANFINGELMGKVASADLPWAVKFPQDIFRWIGYEPQKLNQLTPIVEQLGISPSQWTQWISSKSQSQLYNVADRIIDAIQNGNETIRTMMGTVLEPRHPSQLYAALGEGFIPLIILIIIWLKPRKPGLISGVYLMLYACFRVADEFFRLPDAHLADLSKLPLGLSRGQFLSLFIFAFGLFLIYVSQKRHVPAQGGLWSGAPETPPAKKISKKKK